jgi:SAM-dependent methyltransferase
MTVPSTRIEAGHAGPTSPHDRPEPSPGHLSEEVLLPFGLEITPQDIVVDIGCGEGGACVQAGKSGAEVVGIDIDPICIERADEAMRGGRARSWKGLVSDCNPIPLPDGYASVVLCTEVLEHVDDPVRLLAELWRIGRPGAYYLLSVPDPTSEFLMRGVAPPWYWKTPYHVRVFEREEFEGAIRAAGFTIVEQARVGFYHSMWWTFRMALGASRNEATPGGPLLENWDRAWEALGHAPGGKRLAEDLDALVPKSQTVLAVKRGDGSPKLRNAVMDRARWKRLLRDGEVRLGPYSVRWAVRRHRARPAG